MTPFRGRVFKDFVKVCGSNGHTYKIIVYKGKPSINEELMMETIITSLWENYLNEGLTIATDNLYPPVLLAENILLQNMHWAGTLKKNRWFYQRLLTKI